MTCQNSTWIYLQRETASVMLGSTAYVCNTWKHSTCCCLCQTNVSNDVSVLSQGLPIPAQSRAPALLLGTSFWQAPPFGLASETTAGLVLYQQKETGRAAGLHNSVPPIRKNHLRLSDGVHNPHFATQVVYAEAGKGPEDSIRANKVVFYLLLFSAQVIAQQSEDYFQKEKIRTNWRSCYITATAIYWLCCLKYTPLDTI